MDEGFIEREGVRLHYLEWRAEPARQPAILLLHGLGSNARFWERLAARLPGRRLVALDQRNHGGSDRPQSGHDARSVVADVADVIEQLELGRPLVVGHSWGAPIALELAATCPDLAAGLVFLDGPAVAMTGLMTWDEAARMMQPPLPEFGSYEEAENHLATYLGDAYGADLAGFVRAGLVESGGRYRSTLTAPVRLDIIRALYYYQPELLFPQVQGPVLLGLAETFSHASESAIQWRRRAAETAVELQPATQVRWYDSAHDIPLIRPDELAAHVERTAIAAGFADVARRTAALRGDWSREVKDEGGWPARELLAHLASTQTALPQILRAERAEGQTQEPFDPDRWNAAQIRRRQGASHESMVEELLSASMALHAALLDDDLSRPAAMGFYAGRPLDEMLDGMLAHQRSHLATLQQTLQGQEARESTTA